MRNRKYLFETAAIAAVVCSFIGLSNPVLAQGTPVTGGSVLLPAPEPQFGGVIGRKASESRPDFPQAVTAPKGAPNVLLIMTDDTGFGASSTFGGPIPTPNLERVYQHGLCYNQFHTTALCSPTRAALLTGRNHHSVGFGNISEFASGYPGYNSILPKSAGTIGNILVGNGYNTSWFGKNHLIPDWLESPDGPFDQWASGLGFEYFYGFLGGDTDNWHPALFENTKPVLPPVGDPNYILIRDMGDRAINWIRTQHAIAPDKPFLMYFAPGNGHAPHHATKDWIAKFKGKFDQGWDKQREETLANQKRLGIVPADTVLTPRPKDIPAWDSLNADQKKVYARMMEVYAAAVAQSDYEIGRVIDGLEESGQLDNTLIIYIEGDNGASGEGTLEGTTNELGGNLEPEVACVQAVDDGRAWKRSDLQSLSGGLGPRDGHPLPVDQASRVALRRDAERDVHELAESHQGPRGNPLPVPPCHRHRADDLGRCRRAGPSDPQRRDANAVGRRQHGLYLRRCEGADAAHDPVFRNHREPRALRDGWMASTTPLRPPWVVTGVEPDPDDFPWELYNVAEDFSQSKDLAKENPKKLLDCSHDF